MEKPTHGKLVRKLGDWLLKLLVKNTNFFIFFAFSFSFLVYTSCCSGVRVDWRSPFHGAFDFSFSLEYCCYEFCLFPFVFSSSLQCIKIVLVFPFYRRRSSFDRVGAFTPNWATPIQRVRGSQECWGHMLHEFSNSTGKCIIFLVFSFLCLSMLPFKSIWSSQWNDSAHYSCSWYSVLNIVEESLYVCALSLFQSQRTCLLILWQSKSLNTY